MKELVETENSYVQALRMLKEHFIKPLSASLPEAKKDIIFLKIKELIGIHTGFYSQLCQACQDETDSNAPVGTLSKHPRPNSFDVPSRISDVFLRWKEKFVIYGEYIENLTRAQETIDELCESEPAVKEQVAKCELAAKDGKFKLRDLLTVPMQRVLKYHLLLDQLIKNTSPDHDDYDGLKKAHGAILDLNEYLNEVKRDSDDLQAVHDILLSIEGDNIKAHGGSTDPKKFGRHVKEGELKVLFHDNPPKKNRYIFVFDKVLLICKASRMVDKIFGVNDGDRSSLRPFGGTVRSLFSRHSSVVVDSVVPHQRGSSPLIIVHGGASAIADEFVDGYLKGIQEAAVHGFKALSESGSSLDAVEAAVNAMEDNPFFNAGCGGSLTSDRTVELDAGIMEGATLRAGAVANVKTVRNAVSLARAVLEKTEHVLLAGEGAERYARSISFPQVENKSLISEVALKKFQRETEFHGTIRTNFSAEAQVRGKRECGDTVGAVAIDSEGRIAVGISTGGLTAKMPGRVGDSPLVGCGMFVDDTVGGVCTTGHGEAITRVVLAYRIYSKMAAGTDIQTACDEALEEMRAKIPEDGSGGAIAVSAKGEVAFSFNTYRMAWAVRDAEGLRYGIDPGQVLRAGPDVTE